MTAYSALPAYRVLLQRGSVIALLARTIAGAAIVAADVVAIAPAGMSPVHFEPIASVVVIGLSATLMLIDGIRRRDDLLFANLGLAKWQIACTAALPALAIEVALTLVP